jgi:hypothetical protein
MGGRAAGDAGRSGVIVILPIKTVSITNANEHWRVRARRVKYEHQVVSLLMPKGVPVPCIVKLTRVSSGTLDTDNLPPSMKAIRDQISRLSGVDDADPRITWVYAQERINKRQYEVRVEVIA